MGFKPDPLPIQGLGSPVERSNPWATHRRKVCPPSALVVRFYVTSTADGEQTQSGQVDGFRVETPDLAVPINHELHLYLHW
jgi:hypothetical protein